MSTPWSKQSPSIFYIQTYIIILNSNTLTIATNKQSNYKPERSNIHVDLPNTAIDDLL